MRHAFRALALALFGCVVVAGPAAANPFTWSPDVAISDPGSPFAAGCQGPTAAGQSGRNFPGTKVEPWLAVDPSNNSRQIAFWQQDRWSDGGANGLIEAYTIDGGATWVQPPVARQPKFSYCTGGSGVTGGYTRASDRWVTLSPNGNAWAMALQADIGLTTSNNNAMSVARSTDGGQSWDAPILLKRDTSFNTLNDKNSATADRLDSNYAYAIWDRLEFPNAQAAREAGEHAIGYRGPTWFSRTTNGTSTHPTWSPARIIYDPGEVNQTIGNQIVQTASGRLVDGFALIYNFKNAHKARGVNVAVLTSDDRGATWSGAKIVAPFVPGTVSGIRSGDIIPEIAADPSSENVYLIWQARAASGKATIMLSRSTNAGRSWSAPAAINARQDVDAFTPSISVAPNGVVTATYYDLRAATAAQPYLTETRSIPLPRRRRHLGRRRARQRSVRPINRGGRPRLFPRRLRRTRRRGRRRLPVRPRRDRRHGRDGRLRRLRQRRGLDPVSDPAPRSPRGAGTRLFSEQPRGPPTAGRAARVEDPGRAGGRCREPARS